MPSNIELSAVEVSLVNKHNEPRNASGAIMLLAHSISLIDFCSEGR